MSEQPPAVRRLKSSLDLTAGDGYCLTVSGTKVFVMPGGMMKSNGNLVELIEKVKPEIRTLIEKCNTVRNTLAVGGGSRDHLSCSCPGFPCAGQDVGAAADPQDRGRQQLRRLHPGGDGG